MYGDERFIGDALVRAKEMPATRFTMFDGTVAIATAWRNPRSSVIFWRAMVDGRIYGPYTTISAMRERIEEDIRGGRTDVIQGGND